MAVSTSFVRRFGPLLNGLILVASVTAFAASPKLKKAEDLYDDGSFAQARSALKLLVSDPSLDEKDRGQARLYLAASEFALGDAFSAKRELKTLAAISPEVRPDPNVFLPDFVALADTARKEAGVTEEPGPGRHHRRRRGEGEVAKTPPAPTPPEVVKKTPAQPPGHQTAKVTPPQPASAPSHDHEIAKATPPAPSQPPPSTPIAQTQPAAPVTAPVPTRAPSLTPKTRSTGLDATRTETSQAVETGHSHTWAYVAYGVAGAAAITSALFYLQAKSSAQDAAKATTDPSYTSARNDADSKLGVSNAAGIAAAVAAGGGTILFFTSF